MLLRLTRLTPFIGAVAFGLAAALVGCGHEVQPQAGGSTRRIQELDRLIDAVVSHNEQPKTAEIWDRTYMLFGKDFDWKDQKRVQKAVWVLSQDESNDLWARLVEHRDDTRYAVTGYWTAIIDADNLMVGDICRELAFNHLLCAYLQYLLPGKTFPYGGDTTNWVDDDSKEFIPGKLQEELHNPPHLGRYSSERPGQAKLKTWYDERRGKPLYELQIEICEWAVKRVESDPTAAAKPKKDFVGNVKRQIELLKKTMKPVVDRMPYASPLSNELCSFFDAELAQGERDKYVKRKEEHDNEGKSGERETGKKGSEKSPVKAGKE
jgi:hypothetical protein